MSIFRLPLLSSKTKDYTVTKHPPTILYPSLVVQLRDYSAVPGSKMVVARTRGLLQSQVPAGAWKAVDSCSRKEMFVLDI